MAKDTTNHSIFAHMNDEEIAECYEMYRSNEMKNTEIIELYELGNISASALLKQFPMIQTNLKCPLCSEALLERPTAKTDRPREHQCPSCHHELFNGKEDPYCPCDHCVATRAEMAKKQREALEVRLQHNLSELIALYPVPSSHIHYTDLSLIDKIYLASLIPLGNFEYIPSQRVTSANSVLSPAGILDKPLYAHLIERGIIFPVMDGIPKEHVLNLNTHAIENMQRYSANVTIDGSELAEYDVIYSHILSDFEAIMNGRLGVSEEDIEQLFGLIENIEVAEAVVFLSYFCQEADLPEPPKKTYDVMRKMLTQMSVSELAPHIKKCVKDAAYFFITGKSKGKVHAVNTIPSKIESSVAYYKKQGWSPNKWERPYNTEKSNLSCVVYDKLLVHLNLGFYQSIGDIIHTLQQFFEVVLKREKPTQPAIADMSSTNALLCSGCGSSNLQLLDSQKGVLVFCLECNGTQLLQPATDN